MLKIKRWKLQILNSTLRRRVRFCHVCSIKYGYALVNSELA